MKTFFQLNNKRTYALIDSNGKILEYCRLKATANKRVLDLKKEHGKRATAHNFPNL